MIEKNVVMMSDAFKDAGLSGDMAFVECSCEEEPESVSGIILPIESFDMRTKGINPSTGLLLISHVLDMIEATLAGAGRDDLIDELDEAMKAMARPTMTKTKLFGKILPKMEEGGGSPVIWEIKDDDEESVLIIAKSCHFSELDGLPDAYVIDALMGFIARMLLKGAGEVPTGSEVSSMLDSLEQEINRNGKER